MKYTRETIKSIKKYTNIPFELILIDNASDDGTPEYLINIPNAKVILNDKNIGFPSACNQGIGISKGNYILLLNNDVIVTESWLENLLKYFHSHPDIGIVGPKTNFISGPQVDKNFPNEVVSLENNLFQGEKAIVDYAKSNKIMNFNKYSIFPRITAFCMLIRKEIIDKIGGFDERFGLGNYEDDDFCLRTKLLGFKSLIAHDVFIFHFGSISFFVNGQSKYEFQLENNKKIFIEKWGKNPEEIFQKQETPNDEVSLNIPLKTGIEYPKNIVKDRIALCMIVRNEESNLTNCLNSVYDLVDEIIIVDTGSEDNTKMIAKSFGAKIYDYKWDEDFSKARNFALKHVTSEWIFVMDADEVLDLSSLSDFNKIRKRNSVDAYTIEVYNEQEENSFCKFDIFRLTRLFRNKKDYRYSGIIHEQIRPSIEKKGDVIVDGNIKILHYGYSRLSEKKIKRNLRFLEKALKDDPDNAYLNYQIGITILSENKLSESLKYLEYANSLYLKNELSLTKEIYIKLLTKISQVLLKTDLYEESLAYINRALKIDPKNILSLYISSANEFLLNNYDISLTNLSQIENILVSENASNFDFCTLYIDKGNCHYRLLQYEKAISEYNKALEYNYNSYLAFYNLGNALSVLGDKVRSLEMFKMAFKINPDFDLAKK